MYNFNFVSPTTVSDAAKAMKADGAQALGGGQTLLPTMKQRLASPTVLVSLTGVSEMIGVTATDRTVKIGGATTHSQIVSEASAYPALVSLAGKIGDPAVRNRGTMGGSLANNDPAACYPAAALGSGATITTDQREIAADDFFVSMFETALDEGEIITSVSFPIPQVADYQKFEQPASRFALVGVFVAKYENAVRVAVTGASDAGVFRWSEAETALNSDFSANALKGMSVESGNMLSDLHGSGAYRANLAAVLTRRAVEACA